MSYIEKVLLPDERIAYAATLHWIMYVPGMVITILGGLVGYFGFAVINRLLGPTFAHYLDRPMGGIGLAIVLVGVALLSGAYVRQTSTELAVTNRRIIAKYGFISRTTFEIMINRVTGSNFDQTVMGRLLGFGTVLVHGAGGDISPFDQIDDPQAFHQALMKVIEHLQR